MSSSHDMKDMYSEAKPQYPDSKGNQYADNPAGAGVSPIGVTYNQDLTEVTADHAMHEGTTAGEGSWNWGGQQYNEDFGAGESKRYGVEVTDHGKSPQVERTSVDVSRADRGKES